MISIIPNGAVLPLQRELWDLRGLAAARLAADDDDAVRHDDLPQRPRHPRRGQPHQQQAAVAERREVNATAVSADPADGR